MSFLPQKYKVPSNSNYLKLKQGENTFRILSSAIIGYEYWNQEDRPVRSPEKFVSLPKDIKLDEKTGKPKPIKHFWAFVVWNYEEEKIQIMEVTQVTIQTAIKALVDNKKWGDPKKYDITITKTGEGMQTEYSVMPNPHTALIKDIDEDYKAKNINLEALYSGDDPFNESQIIETSNEDEMNEAIDNLVS